jgi:hypothetical protein
MDNVSCNEIEGAMVNKFYYIIHMYYKYKISNYTSTLSQV